MIRNRRLSPLPLVTILTLLGGCCASTQVHTQEGDSTAPSAPQSTCSNWSEAEKSKSPRRTPAPDYKTGTDHRIEAEKASDSENQPDGCRRYLSLDTTIPTKAHEPCRLCNLESDRDHPTRSVSRFGIADLQRQSDAQSRALLEAHSRARQNSLSRQWWFLQAHRRK